MEYSKLVAVTGIPGLHELVSSKNDGAIVRSLEDNTTRFASSRIHNFSHLESIEIYTTGENVNLVEIFHAMEKAGTGLPDSKDNAAIKKYFEEVYPDLDFERVYTSDLKKMLRWFDILQKNKVEIKLSELPAEETEEEAEEAPAAEQPEEKKPAKKKAKEPKAEKEAAADTDTAEKPARAKKTAAKKEEEAGQPEAPKKAAAKKK
ncbi:MAG: DUF5606 domain-containing protein [Chitinophagaceae bacterium]